jgi:hypothetical protein
VLTGELGRRRPDLSIRVFSASATAFTDAGYSGDPVELLDDFAPPRDADLAADLDLVIVTFTLESLQRATAVGHALLLRGAGLGTRTAATTISVAATAPALGEVTSSSAGHTHCSLLDDGSELAWRAAGAPDPDAIVPHPAVVADRLFPTRLLDARREFLRAIDVWPGDEPPVVVQGGRSDLGAIDALVERNDRPIIVLVAERAAGDDEFARAVLTATDRARRLPDNSGLEDQLATIAGARAVRAASPVVRQAAAAFSVPATALRDGAAVPTAPDAVARVDNELDRLATLGPGAGPGPSAWSELDAMRRALEARGARLAHERVVFADAMVLERARYHELLGRLADMQQGYDDIRNLEVVRWRIALGNLKRRFKR